MSRTQEVFSDSDECQLIEHKRGSVFNTSVDEFNMKKMAIQKARKAQRKYMVSFSMFIPLIKFLLACISLSFFIGDGTTGHEMMKTTVQGDALFFYILATIPVSAITLVFGGIIFSNIPKVSSTTVDGYLIYRGAALLLEIFTWFVCLTKFYIPIQFNVGLEMFVLTEAYSILLMKTYANERYSIAASEQQESSSTVEMQAVKTDPECKPVTFLASGPSGQVVTI